MRRKSNKPQSRELKPNPRSPFKVRTATPRARQHRQNLNTTFKPQTRHLGETAYERNKDTDLGTNRRNPTSPPTRPPLDSVAETQTADKLANERNYTNQTLDLQREIETKPEFSQPRKHGSFVGSPLPASES
ncbi:unnamed protein product [Arabidopsis lyrata]|nr:unnamed protein product [Arabidopsis lyrata]